MAEQPETRSDISRRALLKTAGAAGAAAFIPGSAEAASASPAPGTAPLPVAPAAPATPVGPLMNLTAHETEILSAMVDRLIPSDKLGPGALEAGALRYIDRTLGEAASGAVEAYRVGLAALDRYSEYSRGKRFLELSNTDKDSVLLDLQTGGATGAGVGFIGSSGGFFNMVKSHTWQGVFGDPLYGGNVDFIGWDLIEYPGVRMRVSREEQRRLEEDRLPPTRQSAYEYAQFQVGEED